MNLPNFIRRRESQQQVKFVNPSQVFQPMVAVVAQKDVSGWVDKRRRLKWNMSYGKKYYLSKEKAREFMVKGYVYGPDSLTDDVSDDERADILSNVTIISMGAPTNG